MSAPAGKFSAGSSHPNYIGLDAVVRCVATPTALYPWGVIQGVFYPVVVNSVVKPHKKRPNAKSDLRLSAVWSPGEDLNPRPTDYKSVALPLRHQGPAGCRQPALTVATNPNIGQ